LQAPRAPPVFVFARSAPNEREGSSLGLEHLVSRHSMPGMLHPSAHRLPAEPNRGALQDRPLTQKIGDQR
jgi:hypothetical protein